MKVSVPFADTAGWPPTVNSPLLPLLTMKFRACPPSLAGPALRLVAQVKDCGPAFSDTVSFTPLVKLGASLTAVTVTWTVAVALPL